MTTTTALATEVALVAGVDAAAQTLAQADLQAGAVARVLLASGIDASGLAVLTHVVGAADHYPHVALSVRTERPLGAGLLLHIAETLAVADLSHAEQAEEIGLCSEGRTLGLPALARGALAAADELLHGSGGRAVCFPGGADLPEVLTVCELLDRSAIDEVRLLGGASEEWQAGPDARIRTRGHVRSHVRAGRLVLDVQPAADALVPFESPNPTPCCAFH